MVIKLFLIYQGRQIRVDKDVHVRKFRFNREFSLLNAELFLNNLLSSSAVQQAY